MLAACAACTFHAPTYAGDSWTGNDKREHFAYSAMTAVVVQAVVPNPWAAAALASAPGLLRELTGSTGFSHKDMAWNLAGVALGVAGGREVRLSAPPDIGVPLEAMDYAPGEVATVMPRREGWRDMTPAEIAAARRLLEQLTAEGSPA